MDAWQRMDSVLEGYIKRKNNISIVDFLKFGFLDELVEWYQKNLSTNLFSAEELITVWFDGKKSTQGGPTKFKKYVSESTEQNVHISSGDFEDINISFSVSKSSNNLDEIKILSGADEKLYHGTTLRSASLLIEDESWIEESYFKKGDFGQGYYLTDDIETAIHYARVKAVDNILRPVVIEYDFSNPPLTRCHLSGSYEEPIGDNLFILNLRGDDWGKVLKVSRSDNPKKLRKYLRLHRPGNANTRRPEDFVPIDIVEGSISSYVYQERIETEKSQYCFRTSKSREWIFYRLKKIHSLPNNS